jgi:pyrroloquinoline quinone biosynthesis protein D
MARRQIRAPAPVAMTEPSMFLPDSRFEIHPLFQFQWEESQQAFVLLYPEGIVKLSPSAGEILRRLAQGKSVGETIAELQRTFVHADIEASVRRFLETSHAKGWIRIRSGNPA